MKVMKVMKVLQVFDSGCRVRLCQCDFCDVLLWCCWPSPPPPFYPLPLPPPLLFSAVFRSQRPGAGGRRDLRSRSERPLLRGQWLHGGQTAGHHLDRAASSIHHGTAGSPLHRPSNRRFRGFIMCFPLYLLSCQIVEREDTRSLKKKRPLQFTM